MDRPKTQYWSAFKGQFTIGEIRVGIGGVIGANKYLIEYCSVDGLKKGTWYAEAWLAKA